MNILSRLLRKLENITIQEDIYIASSKYQDVIEVCERQ